MSVEEKPSSVGVPTQHTGLSSRAPVVVARSVSKKEGSVGLLTLPAVLPTRAPVVFAAPVSQTEFSVGIPTLPAVLPATLSHLVNASVESKGGDVGFPTSPQSSHTFPFPVLPKCSISGSAKGVDFNTFSKVFRFAALGVGDSRVDPQQKPQDFLLEEGLRIALKISANMRKKLWLGRIVL